MTKIKRMLNRNKKQFSWGGKRPGAGRPKGGKKTKICVSVNESNWNTAIKRWKKKPSWLVDWLVSSYVNSGNSALRAGVEL